MQSYATSAVNYRASRPVRETPVRNCRCTRMRYCLISCGTSTNLYRGAATQTYQCSAEASSAGSMRPTTPHARLMPPFKFWSIG